MGRNGRPDASGMTRAERLALELRANLRRRKEQARARRAGGGAADPADNRGEGAGGAPGEGGPDAPDREPGAGER